MFVSRDCKLPFSTPSSSSCAIPCPSALNSQSCVSTAVPPTVEAEKPAGSQMWMRNTSASFPDDIVPVIDVTAPLPSMGNAVAMASPASTFSVAVQLLERLWASCVMETSAVAPSALTRETSTPAEYTPSPAVTSGATPSSCIATVPAPMAEAFRLTVTPVLGGPMPGVTVAVATTVLPTVAARGDTARLHVGGALEGQSNVRTSPLVSPPVPHSNWLVKAPVPTCTPTVALLPALGTLPYTMSKRGEPSYSCTSKFSVGVVEG